MNGQRVDFTAIGTQWQITTATALAGPTLAAIRRIVENFDRCYSRFRQDSEVSAVASAAGTRQLPGTAAAMLSFYRTLYQVTDGQFSPLVGSALEHLGYDRQYSLQRRPGTAVVPRWDDVMTVQGSTVTTVQPVLLDFGAAGKGYLVDLVAAELSRAGHDEFLVDAGGDLVQRGPQGCRVGLEDPADPTRVIGVANVHGTALCGSATNRRSWGAGLHHVIDPRTAEPSGGVLATWVVAGDAMTADGLATALFLTSAAVLARHFLFGYVMVLASGGVEYSTNFDGELFT